MGFPWSCIERSKEMVPKVGNIEGKREAEAVEGQS
jgi:hypothetical protein